MMHIAVSSQALFVILHLLLFPSTWASLNHAGLVSSAQGVRLSRVPLNYYKSSKTWKLQEIPSRWIPLLEWFYSLLPPYVLSQASVFKSRMDKMEVWATAWQHATAAGNGADKIPFSYIWSNSLQSHDTCKRCAHTRGGVSRSQTEPKDVLLRTTQPAAEDNLSPWQGDRIWASQVEREAEANHLCHGAG